jgi:hypothetical protein
MSLFHPATGREYRGKTAEHEDRFNVRFVELEPPEKTIQTTISDSADPAFSGEMILVATFEAREGHRSNHRVQTNPVGYSAWGQRSRLRLLIGETGSLCRVGW